MSLITLLTRKKCVYFYLAYTQTAAIGEPLVFTNGDGKQWHYRYDARGNRTMVIDPLSNETDYAYNLANQMTATAQYTPYSSTPSHAFVTETVYNYLYPGGPMTSEQVYSALPTGASAPLRETDYNYGHEGELLSESAVDYVTNPSAPAVHPVVAYTYDALYRVTSITDGDGLTINGSGQVVTNGSGHTTSYTYSPTTGQLTQVQYPKANASIGFDEMLLNAYDADGNLLTRLDGNGVTTSYSYNDAGSLLTKKHYALPSPNTYNVASLADESLGYDAYGRLRSLTDGVFLKVGTAPGEALSYDDLDELTSKTFSYSATVANLENLTVSYAYNPDGSRSGMTVPMGSGTTGSFSYGYDDLGRMASLTSPMGDETDWLYHTNDWLSSQYDFDGSSASGTPILKDSYSYAGDARGLVSRLFDANSTGGHIAEFGSASSPTSPMTYDAAGNRTSMSVSDIASPAYSGTTSYTYDYKDELTQETTTRNSGATNNFAYDVAGNFTTNRSATVPAANADNQLTASGYSYDGDGNPTTYAGTTLKFDPENRMTAYGSAETNGYGMDGLRVWRTQSGVTTYYIYDEDNEPVVELSSSGAFMALNSFGDNGLISRATGTAATAKHFYAFDPQGSPSVILDGTGTQVAAAETDAFGKSVYTSNVSTDPYAGFGSEWGYYTDASAGLQLLGHRYYDTSTGRFINRDPTKYTGGYNLYSYTHNRTVDYFDPAGYWPWPFYPPDGHIPLPGDYGHYCGAFVSSRSARPIDAIDSCCEQHDHCLDAIDKSNASWCEKWLMRKKCDFHLCMCAFRAEGSGCTSYDCHIEALTIIDWFCGEPIIGSGPPSID